MAIGVNNYFDNLYGGISPALFIDKIWSENKRNVKKTVSYLNCKR